MSEDAATPAKLMKLSVQSGNEGETDPEPNKLISQMKDEILNLKRENASLRNKVLELEGSDGINLPELALVAVFRHLATINDLSRSRSDVNRSLLSCRLVCKAWKNAFDSTPDLWRLLTFSCNDPVKFLRLRCSPQVKCISFKRLVDGFIEDYNLIKCLSSISKPIERVRFEFDRTRKHMEDRQQLVFYTILSNCAVLHTLEIGGSHFSLLHAIQPESQLNCSTILKLEVDFELMSVEDIAALRDLMIRLPGLRQLALNVGGDDYDYRDELVDENVMLSILTISSDYMNQHPGGLERFHLNGPCRRFVSGPFITSWTVLLLNGCKHRVIVDSNMEISLNNFLDSEDNMADNRKYYADIHEAKLTIPNDALLNNVQRISFCVNLTELEIELDRDATVEELSVLTNLEKLTTLSVKGWDGIIPQQVFAAGIPSLETLRCDGDGGFEPDIFAHFAEYFPNLTDFSMLFQVNINETEYLSNDDFISSLAKLQNLKSLHLQFVKLTDAGLASCTDFKSLKHLSIMGSKGLSDACLLNGVCHIKTLETLTLNCHSELNPKKSVFTAFGIDAVCKRLNMERDVEDSIFFKDESLPYFVRAGLMVA